MATFAEFPSHHMANDFTLFSYNDPSLWQRDDDQTPSAFATGATYLPTSYAEQHSFDASAFDHYPLASNPDQYDLGYAPQQQPQQHPALEAQHQQASLQLHHQPPPQHIAKLHHHDSPAAQSIEYGQNPPLLSSTSDSGASVQSTLSSATGSPAVHPPFANHDWTPASMSLMPEIVSPEFLVSNAPSANAHTAIAYDLERSYTTDNKGCVDPSLIQPTQFTGAPFHDFSGLASPPSANLIFPQAPSPAPSWTSVRSPRAGLTSKMPSSPSPYLRTQSWQPYPSAAASGSRRPSISSVQSRHSQNSQASSSEDSNKGQCPIATCGRLVKDLKAHMLTHQNERPEKCPIPTCEYHIKGFARKYDKNRHTLTHYKGTMVCGFCPGSGSAAEKSFNRADVFKRHLTSVHGVEQTPPNARKKGSSSGQAGNGHSSGSSSGGVKRGASSTPFTHADVSGMCSTCGVTFASAQDFYEHLDDCVLRVVQQADPSEAINEKLLSSLADDAQVRETMEKNHMPTNVDYEAPTSFDEEDDGEDDDEMEGADDGEEGGAATKRARHARRQGGATRPALHSRGLSNSNNSSTTKEPRKGLTYSKNGVPLYATEEAAASIAANNGSSNGATAGKAPKRRKHYPLSWGAAPEKMKMRKRVLCVYEGQRRLWKDDMMLDAAHEVRIPLAVPEVHNNNGDETVPRPRSAWVTDLDIQTLRRAEGIHGATDEEKGPWLEADGGLPSQAQSSPWTEDEVALMS